MKDLKNRDLELIEEINRLKNQIEELEARVTSPKITATCCDQSRPNTSLEAEVCQLNQLLEHSPFPVSIIDPAGRYLFINRRFTELFGYTLEDVPTGGQWFRKAFPDPDLRGKAIALWNKDLATMDPQVSRTRSFRVTCKDGSTREIIFRPVTMDDGRQFVCYEDVTALRRLQQELIQDHKLEAGEFLASGVAHHLNNILTAIMGNLSLAQHEKGIDRNLRDLLTDAERACILAQDLSQNLMDYAVGPPLDLAPADAAELVEIYCRPPALPHDIRINLQAEAELPPALIDRDRFAQALANLVNNAVEAMPLGGPIDIRTENVILEPAAEAPILPPGPYLKITIQDHGIGIPPRHLTRVFDPYFTTKRKGKGMGLAIAFAIVKRHRGTITVESEPGQGAAFTIYFPAAATKNNGRPDCSDSTTPSKTQAA